MALKSWLTNPAPAANRIPASATAIPATSATPAPDAQPGSPWKRGVVLRDADDRRSCLTCLNLSPAGACGAAWRAGRRYSPMLEPSRRCEDFQPRFSDPDQRVGRERWPWLLTR
jgi:hypothetical protein